jgi:hypothetical protein
VLLEVVLLQVGQLCLRFMEFLFESVIGGDSCMLFDEFAAPSLVLFFEGSLEIAELLVLGHKGVPQHVHLYLLLGDFLLVELLEANHSVVILLDLLVFCLYQLVELSLFCLKELCTFLLLLGLPD